MADDKKSTGPNARPRNETIAQSGEGLPDDSSGLPEGAEGADEKKARESLDELEHREKTSDTRKE